MDSTFRTDPWTMDATQATHIPGCRTINCGRDALETDIFCGRCREEIDAVRDTARRRFVIFGASGRKAQLDPGGGARGRSHAGSAWTYLTQW